MTMPTHQHRYLDHILQVVAVLAHELGTLCPENDCDLDIVNYNCETFKFANYLLVNPSQLQRL